MPFPVTIVTQRVKLDSIPNRPEFLFPRHRRRATLPDVKPERTNQTRPNASRRAGAGSGASLQGRARKAMLHPKHVALAIVALLVIAALFYASRNGRERPVEPLSTTNTAPGATPATPVAPRTRRPRVAAPRTACGPAPGRQPPLQAGQPDQAVERYREAGRLLPEDEDVHYNLGIGLARLGRIPGGDSGVRNGAETFSGVRRGSQQPRQPPAPGWPDDEGDRAFSRGDQGRA